MKSVVTAFSQLQYAISAALNYSLTAANIEPKFIWLFGSYGIVAWVIRTVFIIAYVVSCGGFVRIVITRAAINNPLMML